MSRTRKDCTGGKGWSQVNGKKTIADPAATELTTALAALALAGGADGTNSVCPRGFRDRTFPTARAKVPILKFAKKK
jgi:non-ribosomal peptide synthetase component E (peptide arylation enzyme)